MIVTILPNGDVEISAPGLLTFVNVETKLSVMKSSPANIAAPTQAAHRVKARSHVPEARCRTSVRLVKTGDVTPAITPPCIWNITTPTSCVPARVHACQ